MGKWKRAVPPLSCLLLALGVSAGTPLPTLGERKGGVDVVVKVTEGPAQIPIEQVEVELVRLSGAVVQSDYSDSEGRVEFYNIEPGDSRVCVSKPGYVSAESIVDVSPEEMSNEVEVRMSRVRSSMPRGQAMTISARALSIPEKAQKRFRKGFEALNKKNDPQKAVKEFQAAFRAFPDYYEAQFMLGMACLRLKSYREAQEALEKAVGMEPKFFAPYFPLAALLIFEKQYDQAERLLTRGMQLDAQNWRFPFELARENAERGRWDKAIDYGRTARARPNAPSTVHLLMADLYSSTGQDKAAVRELQEFEKADPQSPLMPRVRDALAKLHASG